MDNLFKLFILLFLCRFIDLIVTIVMKVVTPEISWHGKDAVFSIDVQCFVKSQPIRLVTGGLDTNVRVWRIEKGEIKFLSNLSRHEKAVNVVRFSKKSLLIASGGDDGTIVIWKLSDKEEIPNIFNTEEGENNEVWNAYKILRGHLEDINDLSWSHDDYHLVSGSVDHTAILWDIEKSLKLAIFNDSKHFVNGVTWDPLDKIVATMSCDRSLRIYSLHTKKLIHCVNKMVYKKQGESDGSSVKSQRIFHDETAVRRRLSFTIDGKMLITPAGCLYTENSPHQVNTAMIFTRNNLSKPSVILPGLHEPPSVVSCCPRIFELRKCKTASMFKLEYRHIFAVASNDTVVLYDTQQLTPFGLISNIHYASITDLTWSHDAAFLAISSRDGFCSFVFFDDNELGQPLQTPFCDQNKHLLKESNCEPQKPKTDAIVMDDGICELTLNQNDSTGEEKENDKKLQNKQEFMEIEPNSVVLDSLPDVGVKVEKETKATTDYLKPRRVLLETLSATPGGDSPLVKKEMQASVKRLHNGETNPRRVNLITIEK